ncbi:MAG: DUF11 domain-containing protein, partial [Alphaproteobacteria bacterium]|nr:DUF11 domain-containing protein [Alphaproteobacteria bacterium]
IQWNFNETVLDTEQIKLIFTATATTTSGSYTNTAFSDTSYGILLSDPVPVQVDGARVSLSKTPSSYFVDPGESLIYTLVYANDSSVEVTNATLVDTLPADVACNTYSINGAAPVSCVGDNPITMAINTLAGFESGSVEMNVTVGANYTSSSLLNTATLTVTAPDGSDVNKTAESTIAVNVPVAAFTLTKTSGTSFVILDDDVSYDINYTNYGDTTGIDVNITDTIPEGFTYVSSTPAATPNVDGTYTWSLGDIVAGGTGSVQIILNATKDPDVTTKDVFTSQNPAINEVNLVWSSPDNGGVVYANNTVGINSDSCTAYYYTDIQDDLTNLVTNEYLAQTSIINAISERNVTLSTKGTYELLGDFFMDPVAPTDLNSSDFTLFENILEINDYGSTTGLEVQIDFYDYNPSDNNESFLFTKTFTRNGNSDKNIVVSVDPTTDIFNIPSGHRIHWKISVAPAVDKTFDISLVYNSTASRSLLCKTASPSMAIYKTVDTPNILTSGATTAIVYTIDYANTSGTDVINAVVTDTLPNNVTITSSTPVV